MKRSISTINEPSSNDATVEDAAWKKHHSQLDQAYKRATEIVQHMTPMRAYIANYAGTFAAPQSGNLIRHIDGMLGLMDHFPTRQHFLVRHFYSVRVAEMLVLVKLSTDLLAVSSSAKKLTGDDYIKRMRAFWATPVGIALVRYLHHTFKNWIAKEMVNALAVFDVILRASPDEIAPYRQEWRIAFAS